MRTLFALLDGVFTPAITFIITNTLNISPTDGSDILPIHNPLYDKIYLCALNYKRLKRGEYWDDENQGFSFVFYHHSRSVFIPLYS